MKQLQVQVSPFLPIISISSTTRAAFLGPSCFLEFWLVEKDTPQESTHENLQLVPPKNKQPPMVYSRGRQRAERANDGDGPARLSGRACLALLNADAMMRPIVGSCRSRACLATSERQLFEFYRFYPKLPKPRYYKPVPSILASLKFSRGVDDHGVQATSNQRTAVPLRTSRMPCRRIGISPGGRRLAF